MRFATFEYHGVVRSGVVAGEGRGTTVHPLATEHTVLDLVRAGLPAALGVGVTAMYEPGIPIDRVRLRPPLDPPTVRDFVAFEEHVEGVVASVGDGEGVVVSTGRRTEFGKIASGLGERQEVTEFQAGLRHFSVLLARPFQSARTR